MSHSDNFINFVHSSKWLLHTASLLSLANIFSTRLLLIEHLIYLKHFVLFNCLKLMFIVIVNFLCWIVVILLKKEEGKKVIVFKSIFSSFCMVLLLDIGTIVIHLS